MNKLLWRVGSSEELAQLLKTAELNESSAIDGLTLYHVSEGKRERVAISLPNGQALFIGPEPASRPRRRRVETVDAKGFTP